MTAAPRAAVFCWIPGKPAVACPKSQRDNISAAEKAGIQNLLQRIASKLERGSYG